MPKYSDNRPCWNTWHRCHLLDTHLPLVSPSQWLSRIEPISHWLEPYLPGEIRWAHLGEALNEHALILERCRDSTFQPKSYVEVETVLSLLAVERNWSAESIWRPMPTRARRKVNAYVSGRLSRRSHIHSRSMSTHCILIFFAFRVALLFRLANVFVRGEAFRKNTNKWRRPLITYPSHRALAMKCNSFKVVFARLMSLHHCCVFRQNASGSKTKTTLHAALIRLFAVIT